MFSEYVEIHTQGESEDTHFILSKLFTRIHGILKSHSLNIALGFPDLKEYSPGKLIRCFGVVKDLAQLEKNDGLLHLEKRNMISINSIASVPKDHDKIAYRRLREPEKAINGFKKRLSLRNQKRESIPHLKNNTNETEEKEKIKRPPYLILERNGQKLPIHIGTERLKLDSDLCQFNTYGFAKKIKECYAAIPFF
ncbi:type I-F CRISPR-associated endoribonuclease Cas6/Csy4 [Candidatus Nitrosacidococcus tergens]|uniref:CRISPR-associated protein, Csy4 family n=1 Tax=Candidatus Nitrosacidococcus tergens TaxID=553981 RepID=A0A7G1Q8T4_9GAMM|nr:type I-F CRISPR-associated endoribonuclease Cas6/Csy4 [Candidatus Nitrosacidococcus tergens]CAB1275397.1 CRISPR-associated protein, Csy4 family [Candidatus Nitrosacidococcus tergens]